MQADDAIAGLAQRTRIVLVRTSHPGNIGAAARAMKTMGLERLYLVAPLHYPHADATARAAWADDVLELARVCATLEEAIADCTFVVGASARQRTLPWPLYDARGAAERIAAANEETAVVFGPEQSGLDNPETSALRGAAADPGKRRTARSTWPQRSRSSPTSCAWRRARRRTRRRRLWPLPRSWSIFTHTYNGSWRMRTSSTPATRNI
jgi:tRNA(Leu) C34 or U34 (ribose-2'-O)-methylase TrmL